MPHVKGRACGGVLVIGNPLDEVGHDLLEVNLAVRKAIQRGEGHTGIVRPCARGDGIGAVALHIGHGLLLQLLAGAELHRHAQSIAYGVADHDGLELICNFRIIVYHEKTSLVFVTTV